MLRFALAAALCLFLVAAHADGDARSLAHAGATVVQTDDPSALGTNPAGLARRSGVRVSAGLRLLSQSMTFATTGPDVENAGPVLVRPWGGAAFALGDRLVMGAAVLAPTAFALDTPFPTAAYDAEHDDRKVAPSRYAGTHLALDRWALGAGAAVRVLPWLALGAAAFAERAHAETGRTLWAGTDLGDLSPAFDLPYSSSATGWSPALVGGVVLAPPDLPIELGASVLWRGGARLDGSVAPATSRGGSVSLLPGTGGGLTLSGETIVRGGVRLLVPHVAIEVDADLSFRGNVGPIWSLAGTKVGSAPLADVPLGPAPRNSVAVRAGVDVPLAGGPLALLAGYAYATAPQTDATVSPVTPFTAAHTLAAGIEAHLDAARLTFAVSHDFRASAPIGAAVRVIAPLAADAPAVERGQVSSAATTVALDVEVELP